MVDVYIVVSSGISFIETQLDRTHVGTERGSMPISAVRQSQPNSYRQSDRLLPTLTINPLAERQNPDPGVRD